MLGYALLGLCLLAALLLLGKAFVSASPHALLTGLRWGLAGILGVLALFFMVTGRFTYGLPLGLAACGFEPRLGQSFASIFRVVEK